MQYGFLSHRAELAKTLEADVSRVELRAGEAAKPSYVPTDRK